MTTPLNITVVNSEEGPLKSCEFLLRRSYPHAELSLFQDSLAAWDAISKVDPDLLITGTWFPSLRAHELVGRLLERKIGYPIIVMSAFEPEESWVRKYADRGMNIRFLSMPFDVRTFVDLVSASLNTPPDPPAPSPLPP